MCDYPSHVRFCQCPGNTPNFDIRDMDIEKRRKAELHEAWRRVITGDLINHPPHYTQGGIDTFDFIKAKGLTYAEGNVIKYIVRARHKGNLLDDLRKAEWYLKQLIAEAENEPEKT